jgi:glycerol-3-phosphate dehydrogenase
VQSSYAGVRPLIGTEQGKKEEEMPRDYMILNNARGVVSITGGKLTTCRSMAQKAVDYVARFYFQRKKLKNCETISPISGAMKIEANQADKFQFVTQEFIERLIRRYGSNYQKILEIGKSDPTKLEPLDKDILLTPAEIEYFVTHEFVEKLSDIMCRRTQISLLVKDRGILASQKIAECLGKFKGWDQERIRQEIEEYLLSAAWPA